MGSAGRTEVHLALKEWAVTVAALGRGDQTVSFLQLLCSALSLVSCFDAFSMTFMVKQLWQHRALVCTEV